MDLNAALPLSAGAQQQHEGKTGSDLDCTTISNPLLDAALRWLGRGVPVLPLQPKSKYFVKGFGPHLRVVTEPGEARAWFGERSCNLGLCTGGKSGLAVLDFDDLGTYAAWRKLAGRMVESYTEITAHGRHVFFFSDAGLPSTCCGLFELKASGAVVMSAPSVHPSNFTYRPLDPHAPILETLPDFLLLSEGKHRRSDEDFRARSNLVITGKGGLIWRIKKAWPILDLAQSLTKLKTSDGRWYHGLCPLHSESHPSFWLDTEHGLFGCFSCGARGDVVNLYAMRHKMTVQEAIRQMARKL